MYEARPLLHTKRQAAFRSRPRAGRVGSVGATGRGLSFYAKIESFE